MSEALNIFEDSFNKMVLMEMDRIILDHRRTRLVNRATIKRPYRGLHWPNQYIRSIRCNHGILHQTHPWNKILNC